MKGTISLLFCIVLFSLAVQGCQQDKGFPQTSPSGNYTSVDDVSDTVSIPRILKGQEFKWDLYAHIRKDNGLLGGETEWWQDSGWNSVAYVGQHEKLWLEIFDYDVYYFPPNHQTLGQYDGKMWDIFVEDDHVGSFMSVLSTRNRLSTDVASLLIGPIDWPFDISHEFSFDRSYKVKAVLTD